MKAMTFAVLAVASIILGGCTSWIGAPRVNDAYTINPERPVLVWESVRGARFYEVEIATRDQFPDGKYTKRFRIEKNSIALKSDIPLDKHYFWRVRAVDWDGLKGIWSKTGHFVIRVGSPRPLQPSGDINEKRPALKWEKTPNAALYEVEISADDNRFVRPIRYRTAAADYFPRKVEIQKDVTYYWRVRAITAGGSVSRWSESLSFKLVGTIMKKTMTPEPGAVISELQPVFRWNALPSARRYQIEIYYAKHIESAEVDPVVREIIRGNTPQFKPEKPLKPGIEYAWRVRSIGENGPEEWSQYNKFRTSGP